MARNFEWKVPTFHGDMQLKEVLLTCKYHRYAQGIFSGFNEVAARLMVVLNISQPRLKQPRYLGTASISTNIDGGSALRVSILRVADEASLITGH